MSQQSNETASHDSSQFISLRAATVEDEEFLYRVYASTREEELQAVAWSEAQLDAFLRMQFSIQQHSYRAQYPTAEHQIILFKDERAGSMMVHRSEQEIRLIDIALLPQYQAAGIGRFLLEGLLCEAEWSSLPVRLSVLKTNRAQGLYKRLGFLITGDDGAYYTMERRPASHKV